MEALKEAGHTIKDACNALGIARSEYYALREAKMKVKEDLVAGDDNLIEKIKEIKLRHPFWGYRRVRAWLCTAPLMSTFFKNRAKV